ncbi:MAG: acyl carrier protein [Actinomycetota bacterium]|jgi:acyl carrier protein|nr:acyl carrier protein [Actinomycetota bacterium]
MSADSYVHDRNSVHEFVINQIESIGVEADSISLDATLDTLGLDSLDVVELSQSVTKNLGINVGPKDLADAETISDVLAVIHKRAGFV